MFTKLLTPTLVATAKTSPPNTVRVVWVSSSAAEAISPKGFMDNLDYHEDKSSYDKYCISKLGNYLHATEFAARFKADGIVSIPLNPGNLDSDFWRTLGPNLHCTLKHTLLYPPVYGAYTSLFAALSPEVTIEKTGCFGESCELFLVVEDSGANKEAVAPWGKFRNISKDLLHASRTKAQGGMGTTEEFWEWTDAQVNPFL